MIKLNVYDPRIVVNGFQDVLPLGWFGHTGIPLRFPKFSERC